jgi:hypothetical protein
MLGKRKIVIKCRGSLGQKSVGLYYSSTGIAMWIESVIVKKIQKFLFLDSLPASRPAYLLVE